MLSLSNCAIKDSDWQDVEAQIQAELRALDAIDLTHISGDSQMEVLEKENATTAEHSTDQFENLMYRLELQNEKLLHFEHLIFIEETGFDESHRDMEKPASPNLDVSSPRNCRTQNCFLALENLIRPLCILDKEGNSCSKDAYIGPPVLSTKNTRFCKSPKGYRRRTVESPRKLRVQQLHGDNIENMQLSVYTSKTMKNVKDHEKSEEAENVKDHEKSGEAENVKDHEKSEEAENVKERLQDTVCLSHINVSFRGVEVINSNVKPQRRIPVASLPWKVNLVLKDPSLKAFWEAGILIRTCLQTSPYLKPIPFGRMTIDRHFTKLSSRKQRPLIHVFLDIFKFKVIPVNKTTANMSRTISFKQLDLSLLIDMLMEKFLDSSTDLTTYNDAGRDFQALISLFPELDKFFPNLILYFILPFQCLWMEAFSQLFSLEYYHLLCNEISSETCGVRTEKHEWKTCFLPCKLEEIDNQSEDNEGVLKEHRSGDLLKIIKVQAVIRGFLAGTKYCIKRNLLQRRLSCSVTRIQACWRGFAARKLSQFLIKEKQAAVLADGSLQMVSLMDCVDCSEFIQSRTPNHPQVVTLQAFIRGALVRKMKREMLLQREKKIYNLVTRAQAMWKGWRVRKHRFLETLHAERPQDIATIRIQAVWRGFSSRKKFKMLLQKEKEMYNLVTRAQAIWKGWRTRKHGLLERLRAERRLREIATSRIQAIWRGFRTRQRFKMAMLSSRYDEDDEGDYEYATVDEIDEKLWFDDYLKIYPDNSGNLREDKRDIQQECSLDISEEMSKVLTARGKVHFEKDAENIPYNMNSSSFFITRNCTGKSCADGPILSCNSNVPLEDEACTSSQDFIKANEAIDVKQLPCDTTRTAVIEIARDWGFKEEKTALQFLRALENTKRRALPSKTKYPDSQARLRSFMSRTGRHRDLANKRA